MKSHRYDSKKGFTLVELLVVIVVIAILAAISIVAYRGIQNSAKTSAIESSIAQAKKKVRLYAVDNSDLFPDTLADAGVAQTGNVVYQYTSDNTVDPKIFCLTGSIDSLSYHFLSSDGVIKDGICPGQNLLVWDKTGGAAPILAANIDKSVFHTSIESMRLSPGQTGLTISGNPYTGTTGQIYTVGIWVKTSSTWDGNSSYSKIRFADSGGTYLSACPYDGVKTTWTYVSCSYKLTSSVTKLNITLGNNGTAGYIWIDDFSIVLSD